MARILVIDDDETFSYVLKRACSRQGHEVMLSASACEAKEASAGMFDIVFLDISLPDGNGLSLLPLLLGSEGHPEVIMITGHDIPLCFLFLMGYFIVMKYIFKPDVKKLMSLSNDYLQQLRNDLTLNIKEKIAAGALLVFISILLLINILPSSSSGILGILSKGNFLSALIVILIALNFSRLEGGPILDFGGCAQKGIHWNVFWLNAAAMPVSAALSSDAAGITKWFGLMMNNYFIGVEAVVFIIAFTLLLLLATQVAFNMTLVVVAVPIVWQVCQTLGLNPLGVTVLILMAISCAIATPAASSNAAIMFSNVDWIGVPRSFKAGISAMLASMVILLGVGFPLVALIYGF